MKNFKKILFIFLSMFMFLNVAVTNAQDIGLNYAENFGLATANESDPKQMAVDIVKYLMTFLGIIAVVVILYGGFKWMTAAGNEDRVGDAKKIIIAGAVGLVIILCAFAIVTFVVGITDDAISGNI